MPLPRPVADSPEVRALCERLVPGGIPQVLPVEASPFAQVNECVPAVEAMVRRQGGRAELGWQLWETLPGVMIEAEFHAIWVDESGSRHDVTPKPLPTITDIVFLPDPTLVYEGRQIDNVRASLVSDALVNEFIAANSAWFEVINRGDLAEHHGPLRLTPEMQAVAERCERLSAQVTAKYYG